jgi:CRISPR-associated protein Csd2
MGRKHIVPYGLYRVHGFVNAKLAQKTGFSHDDLELVQDAFNRMYDHASDLGNASAHKLFERITVHRDHDGASAPVGDKRTDNWPPARGFSHYDIRLDTAAMPDNITVEEWIR